MDKSIYWYRVRTGLCVECGTVGATSGRYCEECRIKRREAKRRRKERLIKLGRCLECGKPKQGGNTRYCLKCALKTSERASKWYQRKRENELLEVAE